jgi:transcriptional regulator with XRE-family HTH domain
MEWGASRILALRKHAGMTQAQIAQWLGVTTKQVKYLEHQRRNPSGPARRLLGILAGELKFDEATPVQVLGASTVKRRVRRPVSVIRESTPVNSNQPQDAPVPDIIAIEAPKPVVEDPPPQPEAEQSSGDGAFVWQ